MINHNSILKQQLKKLSNSINKKYTVLRKEVIKTTEVFENSNLPVFPYQVCFGLLRQFSETGSLSSSMHSFPFIQTVINLGFANPEMSRQILTFLFHTKSMPKFQILQNQTKLQQILTMLISKKNIELENINFVQSLTNLYLSLQNNRYRVLWLKTTSSFSQITLLLTNQLKQIPVSQQKMKDYNTYLRNLIKITNSQKLPWLVEYADCYLFLQVFSEILDEKYFHEHVEEHRQQFILLMPIIRRQLRKTIEYSHAATTNSSTNRHQPITNQSPTHHSSHHYRNWQLTNDSKALILLRTATKINLLLKNGFDFLEQIIKIITPKKTTTIKLYGYQVINTMFRNLNWMHEMLQSQYADLFNFLLTTQFNNIKNIFSQTKDYRMDLVSVHQTGYGKIMGTNQIDLGNLEFNCSMEVKIIIKNLEEVTYSLYSIYSQVYKLDLHKRQEGKPPLQKTYKFCQKTIFETTKAIMAKEMSEQLLQSLLKIAEKFINLSGCFNDSNVTALYIKMMCKYCLPIQFKNIQHRHVQINKMILNTVNCLGHLLTVNCWVIVWKALQNYSIYYNRYLLGKQQLQAARQSDVQILYKSMDSIFTETPKYQGQYLLEILRSLIQVAYQCLENNYNDETRKIFAFERIQQIYRLNLFRIHVIWPELSSSLLCITTSKVLYFRLSALNLLNILIPLSLNYIKSHPQTAIQSLNPDNYQQIILQPWMNLVNCNFQQIKQQFVIAVNKLIIDYGHIMVNGWKCILEIVKKTRDLKSLQAMVETFLEKVHDRIIDVLHAVDQLERQLQDTNQKYLCLTMIWAIADYAQKNQLNFVLKKTYEILLVPQEMFKLGTEARHSSFYIFAQILVHNCSEKSQIFWQWIFQQIKKFYEYGISQSLKAKDKQFVEQALKNLLTNLIKVYKKLFLVAKQWQSPQLFLRILGEFYLFCEKVLEFRNPQTYQSVLKQIKQILYVKLNQSLSLKQFYSFIQAVSRIYYVETDGKILKCLITYLPAEIYDLLIHCIPGLTQQNFITIYRLSQKLFLLRLQAIQAQIKLQTLRIFFQQKYHYQFMKKTCLHILAQKPELIPTYTQNLVKTIHKLQLYYDYSSITKSILCLTMMHIKNLNINYQLVLELYKKLIHLRYHDNWLKVANHYKDIPVWYAVLQDLMKIAHQYITKQQDDAAVFAYNILRQFLLEDHMQQKVQFLIQQKLSQYYQMDIEISYFLIENYIFSQKYRKIPEEDLSTIVQLVYKRSREYNISDFTKKGSNAYQLLFKLCAYRQNNQHVIKKQKIITHKLFLRISETFKKILQKQTNANQHENCIQQLKFAIKAMNIFEVSNRVIQGIFQFLMKQSPIKIDAENNLILKNKYAHLYYFQPYLAKCIKIKNDEELINILSDTFWKIGEINMGKLL